MSVVAVVLSFPLEVELENRGPVHVVVGPRPGDAIENCEDSHSQRDS